MKRYERDRSPTPDPDIVKGSYSQTSLRSLHELNYKNPPGISGLSFAGSPQQSVASLSQMRLENLVKDKHWEEVEDFGLEELRDGFFDAAFTKPDSKARSPNSDIDDDNGAARKKLNLVLPSFPNMFGLLSTGPLFISLEILEKMGYPYSSFLLLISLLS